MSFLPSWSCLQSTCWSHTCTLHLGVLGDRHAHKGNFAFMKAFITSLPFCLHGQFCRHWRQTDMKAKWSTKVMKMPSLRHFHYFFQLCLNVGGLPSLVCLHWKQFHHALIRSKNFFQICRPGNLFLFHMSFIFTLFTLFFLCFSTPAIFLQEDIDDPESIEEKGVLCGFQALVNSILHPLALWTIAGVHLDRFISIAYPLR